MLIFIIPGGELMTTNHLTVVYKNLEDLLQSKAEALPKGFNQIRFLQNCMTVLQDTKGIEKVEPRSIARTMLKGAFLGLDFFNRECYAVPYGNTLQFLTDYKGEIKLAKKYSIRPIKDIYAKLVREGDEFQEEIVNGEQRINFKPRPFNDAEILGAFAVVLYEDGGMTYDTMSTNEIEHIRFVFSKQSSGKAWTESRGEMYKKTILRRLCKLIELDFDSIEQHKAFEEGSGFVFKEETEENHKSSLEVEFQETDVIDVNGEDIDATE